MVQRLIQWPLLSLNQFVMGPGNNITIKITFFFIKPSCWKSFWLVKRHAKAEFLRVPGIFPMIITLVANNYPFEHGRMHCTRIPWKSDACSWSPAALWGVVLGDKWIQQRQRGQARILLREAWMVSTSYQDGLILHMHLFKVTKYQEMKWLKTG